jgi:hypothetical protein
MNIAVIYSSITSLIVILLSNTYLAYSQDTPPNVGSAQTVNPSDNISLSNITNSTTSTLTQPQSPESQQTKLLGAIFIIGLIVTAWKLTGRKHKVRRSFPESVRQQTKRDQNYKCAICKKGAGVWDYDHIDGNRSNNRPNNCQALCPNCHAKKTRGLLKAQKSRYWKWLAYAVLFIIIVIVALYTNH